MGGFFGSSLSSVELSSRLFGILEFLLTVGKGFRNSSIVIL